MATTDRSGDTIKLIQQCGSTAVLSTVVSAKIMTNGLNFLPLKVSYNQKSAAINRIPGNYFRRDGGFSEKEILASRLIDRSIRSLFPKHYHHETQVTCTLLSSDGKQMPDTLAINGASAALAISDIPWYGPIGAVRVGLHGDKIVVNPNRLELQDSDLDLIVASSESRVVMIEGFGNEIPDHLFLSAVKCAFSEAQKVIKAIEKLKSMCGKTKRPQSASCAEIPNGHVQMSVCVARLKDILGRKDLRKLERDRLIQQTKKEFYESQTDLHSFNNDSIFDKTLRNVFREQILKEKKRCDGRGLSDLRPIDIEIDCYNALHGSCLFRRGETQVFSTVTLDSAETMTKVDRFDDISRASKSKKLLLQYEFPSFANNEVDNSKSKSRREIGHGALARKSLVAVVPTEHPYTTRISSEVLDSNGSSSMATVCGGSLAMMDAGVPILNAVAGVAMGIVAVSDSADNITDYEILTDIMGMEDYLGDMDFKVAGTQNGITGVQADFKVSGLPLPILSDVISKARDAHMRIINIMNSSIAVHRSDRKDNHPVLDQIIVPHNKRGLFIGVGGSNIRTIENVTGVSIDHISGTTWSIFAPNKNSMTEAKEEISRILSQATFDDLDYGAIYEGKIVEIREHGVMVELSQALPPILLHNSQLDHKKVFHPSAIGLSVGQIIMVKYFGIDDVTGRTQLSRKAVLPLKSAQLASNKTNSIYSRDINSLVHSQNTDTD